MTTAAAHEHAADHDSGYKHFVFLVHGTWGKDPAGWYRLDPDEENFASRLAKRLEGTDLEGSLWRDLEVFEWSGENTHEARISAARELASILLGIRHQGMARFHLIAHSHGGNVVLEALLGYLILLPGAILNVFGFPTLVTNEEERKKFFEAARRLVESNYLLTNNATIASDGAYISQYESWMEAMQESFELHAAGRTAFLGQRLDPNMLLLRLARLLLRLGTYRIEHQVSSVVFMGTPFYYKRWRSDRWHRALAAAARSAGQSTLVALVAYLSVVVGGAILSAVTELPFPGFNAVAWPTVLWVTVGAAILAGALWGFRQKGVRKDTNVYFDEASHPTEFEGAEARSILDALVVHAGYLDEAYAGLSAAPILERTLPEVIDEALRPRIRPFRGKRRQTGQAGESAGEWAWRHLRNQVSRLGALLINLAYPIRLGTYRLFTRPFLARQASRIALPLSFGLPPEELSTGEIAVRSTLDSPLIRVDYKDVGPDLLRTPVEPGKVVDRFAFLEDDAVLAQRYAESVASKRFPRETSDDTKRHLLAVEERIREFLGVSGLRHSLYYESEAVVDAVAGYLLSWKERARSCSG